MPSVLVPATIKFTVGEELVRILDAELSLSFQNNCQYSECMNQNGIKNYVLTKGTYVAQNGDVIATIIDTPDKNQEATIKSLQEQLAKVQTTNAPEGYNKNIVVVFENPSDEQFLSVKFQGYISGWLPQSPDGTDFMSYQATFTVYDPTTIELSHSGGI